MSSCLGFTYCSSTRLAVVVFVQWQIVPRRVSFFSGYFRTNKNVPLKEQAFRQRQIKAIPSHDDHLAKEMLLLAKRYAMLSVESRRVFRSLYFFLYLSDIELETRESSRIKNNSSSSHENLCFYFDFWLVAWPTVAGASTATVLFLDFITMATIRCSSMRKARTMLERRDASGVSLHGRNPTEGGQLWPIVSHRRHVTLFSIVWSFPCELWDEMP